MRKLLVGIGVLAAIAALVLVIVNTQSGQDFLFKQAATTLLAQAPEPIEDLQVVICGSASPLGNDPNRAQACIAVVTPEHFFIVDIGARSPLRIAQARLPVGRLDGVLLTHFHSDHISGLPDVNLASWVQQRQGALEVYGPPGVELVVNGFNHAYQLDRKYRTAHHGDELLPAANGMMKANAITPGETVWSDGEMIVSSFLVQHPPIVPAVGYRFDYKGRSVVISGDTNAAESLFSAAKGADLLLHDALSRTLLDPMIAAATENNVQVLPTIMTDVIDYHADTHTLPDRAKEAGIKLLAFYHMVPVPAMSIAEDMFLRGLPDDVILVDDLQRFVLPEGSDAINILEP